MYIQEIFVATDQTKDVKGVLHYLHSYINTLIQHGQVHYQPHPIIQTENGVAALVSTPEEKSLSKECSSDYGRQQREGLERLIGTPLKISVVGTDALLKDKSCQCQDPNFYILFVKYILTGSPLHCGDCFGQIPLYHLNDFDGYLDISRWQSMYGAFDKLQMHRSIGESYGMAQLADYRSDLTEMGIEICKAIEDHTGKQVFYYLFNFRNVTDQEDRATKCPSCKSDWLLDKKLHSYFDFKCDSCGLLSNLTWNG